MNKRDRKYLGFGRYVTRCPGSLLQKVSNGFSHTDRITKREVRIILKKIRAEFDPKKHHVFVTRDFRKSRFIGVRAILKKRQATCGSIATVVASMFRTLGIPTKLVNGYYRKRNPNMRHAWNEIYIESERRFIPFDITRKSFRLGRFHTKKNVWVDWGDLERVYRPGK